MITKLPPKLKVNIDEQNVELLTKFDADVEHLDEDVDFTFEDFEIPERFRLLNEMV